MAGSIRLQIIGIPCLYVDGQETRIEPKIAFQVLAKIILSGESGITRSEIAKALWGHLEPTNARQQLRLAIHNIRQELLRLNLTECLNLDSELLKCEKKVDVDLLDLKARSKWNLKQVQQILKPVCQGWKPEHWLVEADQLCECVENAFASVMKGKHDQPQFHLLVTKACKHYPNSIQLNQLLVNGLRDLGRDAEANEAIIAFEESWLDRFGSGDIPSLEHSQKAFDHYKAVRKRSRWVTGLTIVGALASCGAIFSLNQNSGAWNPPKLEIKIRKQQTLDIHGQKVTVSEFTLNKGEKTGLWQMSNGQFAMHWSEDKNLHILNSNLEEVEKAQVGWLDRLGNSTLTCPESKAWIDFTSDSGKVTITPSPEFPRLNPITILSVNSFLFERTCGHDQGDHRQLCLFKDGLEHPLSSGLGSGIQIAGLNFISANTIYGRFSKGKSQGWKYTAFQSDTTSTQSKAASSDAVWGRASNGDLATQPEITEVSFGNFDTKWDKTVRIVPKEGPSYLLNVDGQEKFFGDNLVRFKDLLIVARTSDRLARFLVAVDYRGIVNPELTKVIGNALEIEDLGWGRSVLMRKQGTGLNYVLIQ